MRLFLGIILGILLTVGGTYIADHMTPTPAGMTEAQVRMVNWDVVNTRVGNLGASIKGLWNKLTGAAPAPEATTPANTDNPATPAKQPDTSGGKKDQ